MDRTSFVLSVKKDEASCEGVVWWRRWRLLSPLLSPSPSPLSDLALFSPQLADRPGGRFLSFARFLRLFEYVPIGRGPWLAEAPRAEGRREEEGARWLLLLLLLPLLPPPLTSAETRAARPIGRQRVSERRWEGSNAASASDGGSGEGGASERRGSPSVFLAPRPPLPSAAALCLAAASGSRRTRQRPYLLDQLLLVPERRSRLSLPRSWWLEPRGEPPPPLAAAGGGEAAGRGRGLCRSLQSELIASSPKTRAQRLTSLSPQPHSPQNQQQASAPPPP
jgi:hypothetical protein